MIGKLHKGLEDLSPKKENPFEEDKFARTETASILKEIINALDEGCVIGLNGKWGTGKSAFISMWSKYMESSGYTVINCNAWENDSLQNPLLGIISEFQKVSNMIGNEKHKKAFNAVLKTLNVRTCLSVTNDYIRNRVGIDVKEYIKENDDSVEIALSECLTEYEESIKALKNFKEALSIYVKDCSANHPLIFVIDELDRCNPTYAVKTLEIIKHMFSVPRVVFVLAIDKEQLCHSINGYFGSEKFNSEEYLRRFIDVEYQLPKADSDKVVNAIMGRFNFDKLYGPEQKDINSKGELADLFETLYEEQNLSIRQLEKYLLFTRIVINTSKSLGYHDCTIALLAYMMIFNVLSVEDFAYLRMSENDFISKLEDTFSERILDDNIFIFSIVELMKSRRPQEVWNEKLFDFISGEMFLETKKIKKTSLIREMKNPLSNMRSPNIQLLYGYMMMEGYISI